MRVECAKEEFAAKLCALTKFIRIVCIQKTLLFWMRFECILILCDRRKRDGCTLWNKTPFVFLFQLIASYRKLIIFYRYVLCLFSWCYAFRVVSFSFWSLDFVYYSTIIQYSMQFMQQHLAFDFHSHSAKLNIIRNLSNFLPFSFSIP